MSICFLVFNFKNIFFYNTWQAWSATAWVECYQEVATVSISLTRWSASRLTNLTLIWWSTFFKLNMLVPVVPRSTQNTELYKLTENCDYWRPTEEFWETRWTLISIIHYDQSYQNLFPWSHRVRFVKTDRKLNCEDWPRIVKTDDRGVLRNPIRLRWLSNRSATHIHTFKRLLCFCDWYLH